MNGGRHISAIALLLLLVSAGIATADAASDAAKISPVDPSGTWKWEYSFNDNPAEFALDLNWDGKELSGKYTAFKNTTDIEEAKFDDGKLTFVSKREFNGNQFIVHFDGKAEENDIVGTVGVDFGEGPREFEWHAKRVVDDDAILGAWKLNLETPQGVVEPQLTITKDGDKLHGEYVSPFGQREPKDLALQDGELSWRIESNEGDNFNFKITYRGKPRGNKMSGSAEFDFGGNTGTMNFTGERTRPERAASADAKPTPPESPSPTK